MLTPLKTMFAVVRIGGHQAIVSSGEKIAVDRIDAEVGSTISLETLLISEPDGSGFKIGKPLLETSVKAKILEHGKGEKIRVYKMLPRKRYRREKGHRQDFTSIEIGNLEGKTALKPKVTAKAKTSEKEEEEKAKTATSKKEGSKSVSKPAEKKKTPAKKAITKKAITKKPTAKKAE